MVVNKSEKVLIMFSSNSAPDSLSSVSRPQQVVHHAGSTSYTIEVINAVKIFAVVYSKNGPFIHKSNNLHSSTV